MYLRARAKSIYKPKDQTNAVKTLLDCANTTAFKNFELKKKRDNDALCPWGGQKKQPNTQLPTTNVNQRSSTLHKHHLKGTFRTKQFVKHQIPRNENELPKISKNSNKLQTIFHEGVCSNIVNLSKQLELFHLRRKFNFLQKKQLSMRLRTQ